MRPPASAQVKGAKAPWPQRKETSRPALPAATSLPVPEGAAEPQQGSKPNVSVGPSATEGVRPSDPNLNSTVVAAEAVNTAAPLEEHIATSMSVVARAGSLPPLSVATMAPKKLEAVNVAAPLEKHITNSMQKLATGVGRNHIEVGFTIYSVTKIDPVEQSFMCDLKIFCRWHDGGMEADPDMKSLREHGRFANGAVFEKDASGRFPPFVVKEIDPELVEHSRPKYNFTNAMDVEAVEVGSS